MAVRFGHASISEKGTINGVKGDSTKKEVCVRTWYNGSWDFMAIHPDESVRMKHANAVEAACNNDNIGYGQGDRNTLNSEAKTVAYDISKIVNKCNCDCSSLQNVAALCSGAKNVTYASNGWTTRTMRNKLKSAGYVIIEDEAYLTSSEYCVKGAIYVREGKHTVCGLDNGSKYMKTLERAGLTKTATTAPIVTVTNKSETKSENKTATNTVKIDPAKSKDTSIKGAYIVTAENLHVRAGAGTNKKSIAVIPKGTVVRNYGFYTKTSSGTNWLYVQFTYKGTKYTGFCSSKYLSKK